MMAPTPGIHVKPLILGLSCTTTLASRNGFSHQKAAVAMAYDPAESEKLEKKGTKEIRLKRKLEDAPEIEIDLQAAEPASKRAKRKAEKLSQRALTAAEETKLPSSTESSLHPSRVALQSGNPPEKKPTKISEHGIWMGNLSFTTTKDDILNFMTTKSNITSSQISRVNLPTTEGDRKVTHKHRSQNRGFAYIDFDGTDTLAKALKLSETLLNGRKVLIKDSSDFAGRPSKSTDETQALIEASTKAGHPPNRRVFIGNLSFEITEQDVRAFLSQCGEIIKVDLCTFEDSGKCKGFGFVDFKELDAAISAVRGWVEVKAEEDDSEEETAVRKRPRKKAVKILNGRPIRSQFAEGPVTRYNKRYGKQGTEGSKAQPAVASTADQPADQTLSEPALVQPAVRRSRAAPAPDPSVAHRTGQIIQSQGQKIVF